MSSNAVARATGGEGSQGRDTLREGILTGLIGAAVVAGWFLVLDLFVGRLFFTPAALGSALFMGAEGMAGVEVGAGVVLGYTAVHVAAFMVVGIAFAALAVQAERNSSLLMAIVLLFVVSLTLAIGLMALLASWVLAALTWWGIAIGNLLAATAMALFLWKRHPRLGERLPEAEERAAAEAGTAVPGGGGDRPPGGGEPPSYRPRGPSSPEGGTRA